MSTLDGNEPYESAAMAVRRQIDAGFPVPVLILNHKNRRFSDYNWHWFLINGYDDRGDTFLVKAVTYSAYEWLDLAQLWDTGYARRGGLILYSLK